MNYSYQLTVDTVKDDNGNQFKTYGILIKDCNDSVVDLFPKLFFCRKKALDFVDYCNILQPDISHILNIIDDLFVI